MRSDRADKRHHCPFGESLDRPDAFQLLAGTQTRVGTLPRTKSQTVEHQSSAVWLSESGGRGPTANGHRVDARGVESVRGFGVFPSGPGPSFAGRRQGCPPPGAVLPLKSCCCSSLCDSPLERAGCREIRMSGSMRGMWKRSYGRATKCLNLNRISCIMLCKIAGHRSG